MMNPDFNTRKKKALEQRHEFYWKQYEAVSQQICGNLNQKDIVALKEQLRQIEAEIGALESELETLEAADLSPKERQNAVSQHLHKIDYTQARKTFDSLLRRVDVCGGAALFLLQESLVYCGDLCVNWMKQQLEAQTGDFKHYPVRFAPDRLPNEFGLFDGIGGRLNESRQDDEPCEQYAERLLHKLYDSARSGTVVLFEFPNWEELAQPDQARVFRRFHDLFWRPLSQQFPAVMAQRGWRNVKCVAVFLTTGQLALPSELCCDSPAHFSCEQVFPLKLKKWTHADIQEWLVNFGGYETLHADEVAAKCLSGSQNGVPHIVRAAIERRFG